MFRLLLLGLVEKNYKLEEEIAGILRNKLHYSEQVISSILKNIPAAIVEMEDEMEVRSLASLLEAAGADVVLIPFPDLDHDHSSNPISEIELDSLENYASGISSDLTLDTPEVSSGFSPDTPPLKPPLTPTNIESELKEDPVEWLLGLVPNEESTEETDQDLASMLRSSFLNKANQGHTIIGTFAPATPPEFYSPEHFAPQTTSLTNETHDKLETYVFNAAHPAIPPSSSFAPTKNLNTATADSASAYSDKPTLNVERSSENIDCLLGVALEQVPDQEPSEKESPTCAQLEETKKRTGVVIRPPKPNNLDHLSPAESVLADDSAENKVLLESEALFFGKTKLRQALAKSPVVFSLALALLSFSALIVWAINASFSSGDTRSDAAQSQAWRKNRNTKSTPDNYRSNQRSSRPPGGDKQKPQGGDLKYVPEYALWSGSQTNDLIHSTIEFSIKNKELNSLRLRANEDPKPPLTKQEFAAGKQRDPWLHNLELFINDIAIKELSQVSLTDISLSNQESGESAETESEDPLQNEGESKHKREEPGRESSTLPTVDTQDLSNFGRLQRKAFEVTENGFRLTSLARAYLDDGNKRTRLIVKVELDLTLPTDPSSKAEATWKISSRDKNPESMLNSIKRTSATSFELLYEATITASIQKAS